MISERRYRAACEGLKKLSPKIQALKLELRKLETAFVSLANQKYKYEEERTVVRKIIGVPSTKKPPVFPNLTSLMGHWEKMSKEERDKLMEKLTKKGGE